MSGPAGETVLRPVVEMPNDLDEFLAVCRAERAAILAGGLSLERAVFLATHAEEKQAA